MRYAEVNAKFTEKVAEYIAKGYVINTATMSGSQGEIANVDLTNGKEIIRINLMNTNGHEDDVEELEGHTFWYEAVVLTVGRATGNVKPNSHDTWNTLWNNEVDVLFKEKFYRAGKNNDYLVSREEAITAYKKMMERYTRRAMENNNVTEDITEVAAPIVLSFVRRQPKCSRVKLDVIKVARNRDAKTGKVSYLVRTKNHSWTLK